MTDSRSQNSRVLPFTAMVLVGGLGTRLQSVVSDRPKPMALVNGVPFLQLLLRSMAEKGARRFVLLCGYMADFIEAHFRGLHAPVEILFSREEAPLGTGGAVRHALAFATDPTLLVNGDTFFDADLEGLLLFHRDKPGQVTLSLTNVPDAGRYGSVMQEPDGRITGFREKCEGAGSGIVNAGCSLLSREFIAGLPDARPFSMEREIFPALAEAGALFGMVQHADFFDIGTPDSYQDFKTFAARKWQAVVRANVARGEGHR